ncbi:MAG: hypothetical protein QXO84_01515 [Candidatus Aenigmatarchaeota archaeon]
MPQPVFPTFIKALQSQGVFEVYLPFLLTFALFYGILRKIGIFKVVTQGQEDKTANRITAMVAFVAAMYVTIFSPAAIPISRFFANFFTQSSVALVTIMVAIMLISMILSSSIFNFTPISLQEKTLKILLAVAGLIAIAMFISSGGVLLFANVIPPNLRISGEDVALAILVILTVVLIGWIISEKDNTPQGRNPD